MTMSEVRRAHTRSVRINRRTDAGWETICATSDLTLDRGAAALVGARAIAIFLLADGALYAIDNLDPISGTSVLSRGIVGDADGAPTVASPMYKQRFDLRTGQSLDSAAAAVAVHEIRITDGMIEVRITP